MPAGDTRGTAEPRLCIVLVTPTGLPQLRRTLDSVAAQTVAEQIELIVVAPAADLLDGVEHLSRRFHSARVIAVGPIENVDHAAAGGLLEATAPIVASIEDHAYPEPDWAERILQAFDDDCVAVGSAMLNANPGARLSWSNMLIAYGRWSEATPPGEIDWVAIHNASFRRSALEPLAAELSRLFNREGRALLRMREAGGRFCFAPAARIRHLNPSNLSSTARLRFDAGRLYAANRVRDERWSWARRLVFAALGAAVPPLVYARMRRTLFAGRRDVSEARHGPALFVGLIFDAAGQVAGVLSGMGGARDRLATFEMNRLDHLTRAERAVFAPREDRRAP